MEKTTGRLFRGSMWIAALVIAFAAAFMFAGHVQAETIEEEDSDSVIYLSDVEEVYKSIGYGSIKKDQNPDGGDISLRLDGTVTYFEKGVAAHAESTVIYDVGTLYKEGYRYFQTYYGINSTKGGSVKFYMYLTSDKVYDEDAEWTECDGVDSSAITGNNNARFVEIELPEDVTYLKLYVDPNGGNSADHSVYADAKFLKEEYFDTTVSRVEVYDEKIASYYKKYGTQPDADADYERLILERDLVDKVGYLGFQELFKDYGNDFKEMLSWLLDDTEFLKMFLTGGSPGQNVLNGGADYSSVTPDTYEDSLRVMYRFWQDYRDDFSDPLDRKMIICLSLTHAADIRFWVNYSGTGTADPEILYSDPVVRYELYKYLYEENELVDYFPDLEIAEMRMVLGSNISNDEILWLRDMAKTKNDDWGGYTWLRYTSSSQSPYYYDKYYDDATWSEYDEKYNLSAYGISNYGYGTDTLVKYPKMWMVMEEGGVCWQMGNFSQNVLSSYGRPSTIAGAYGWTHAVTMVYSRTDDGDGTWTIGNSSGADWHQTNGHAYANWGFRITRWMNDWGVGSYATENNASYIILGQAAINDYENYVESEEILMLADAFADDEETLEEIYHAALSVQDINFDAWYGLATLYANASDKHDSDKYRLADQLIEALTYYPLPMHDLVQIIDDSMESSSYIAMVSSAENTALNKGLNATGAQSLQPSAVKVIANWLLGQTDLEMAAFSFDGEDAGCIVINDRFENPDAWQYSLDGGETWSGEILETTWALSDEEIAAINADDNITIRFVPVPEYHHSIDIEESGAPVVASIYDTNGVYGNDWENKIIGTDNTMEWSFDGEDDWTSFGEEAPDLTGDVSVFVRYGSHGIYTPGEAVEFEFTEDDDGDGKYTYISIDRLNLFDYTAQTNTNRAIKYALDANIYSFYQSISTSPVYVTLELDHVAHLSRLDYQPNLGNTTNGIIREAEIYVSMDGETWEEVDYDDYDDVITWDNSKNAREVTFTPVFGKYIMLEAQKFNSNFVSIGDLRIYEDANTQPEVHIEYSTTEKTTGSVTATLVTDDLVTEILNNGGKNTYTFTENGSFTFEYGSILGQTYEETATVDWIEEPAAKEAGGSGSSGAAGSQTAAGTAADLKKGSVHTVDGLTYKITDAAADGTGTVTLTGGTDKKGLTTLKVKAKVKISGVSYKVTVVGKQAFKGYKNLNKVVLGKNVIKIMPKAFAKCTALTTVKCKSTEFKRFGKRAFFKDEHLKKVTLKTTKLKSKKVQKNAFKGIASHCVFHVPANKVSSYKTYFTAAGAGKHIKVESN